MTNIKFEELILSSRSRVSFYVYVYSKLPIQVTERSKAGRFLGMLVRISPGALYLSFVSVVCCQVEFFETGRSLIQRSPTDCGVSLGVI